MDVKNREGGKREKKENEERREETRKYLSPRLLLRLIYRTWPAGLPVSSQIISL